MQVQFSLLNYIEVLRLAHVNNEHQALLPMRLRGLLHLRTFLPDPVLYIMMITGFGTTNQMPSAAGCSTKVSGNTLPFTFLSFELIG